MSKQNNKVDKKKSEVAEIRLDKYLILSRTYKHRSEASLDIEGGKIKINGKRIKASKMVKVGDEVTFKRGGKYLKFTIKDVTTKNARKDEAKDIFYDKIEESTSEYAVASEHMKELQQILNKQDQENQKNHAKGKPSKKERRVLSKYKRS